MGVCVFFCSMVSSEAGNKVLLRPLSDFHNKMPLYPAPAAQTDFHTAIKSTFPADFLKLVITELITDIPRRKWQLTRTMGSLCSAAARRTQTDNMPLCPVRRALMKHVWFITEE